MCLLGGSTTPAGTDLFSRIANYQTAGDLIEGFALSLWERQHRTLLEALSGFYLLLHRVVQGVPHHVYSALGESWQLTWETFINILRAWIGDSNATGAKPLALGMQPANVPETSSSLSSSRIRASSLEGRIGPPPGSRSAKTLSAQLCFPLYFPTVDLRAPLPPLALRNEPEPDQKPARDYMTLPAIGLSCIAFILCLPAFLSSCCSFAGSPQVFGKLCGQRTHRQRGGGDPAGLFRPFDFATGSWLSVYASHVRLEEARPSPYAQRNGTPFHPSPRRERRWKVLPRVPPRHWLQSW